MQELRRLYLSLGEEVFHLYHPERGVGTVTEEINSILAGGLSMVRVEFINVGLKTFNNNIDSLYCCYHAGIRRHT